jgi:hypothetical protein
MLILSAAVMPGFGQVTPTPETPVKVVQAGSTGSRFLSRWDNPPMQGIVTFQPDQFANRINDSWEYYKFDLWANENGIINNPNIPETESLTTWPRLPGLEFGAGQPLTWEAHGTRLAPRLTGAPDEGLKTIHADRQNWNLPKLPDPAVGRVQLDPTVGLVPVRVIALYVPGSPDFDLGWFSKQQADVLLDDVWTADKTVVTNPNESPHEIIADWTWSAPCPSPSCTVPQVQGPSGNKRNMLPDRIFDQCGVQFREVNFESCPVAEDVFFNQGDSKTNPYVCNADVAFAHIRKAVEKCVDHITTPNGGSFYTNAITLVVAGSLVDPNGNCFNDVLEGEKDGIVVATVRGLFSDTTLAHEFGHALGLGHTGSESDCPDDNLMCPVAGMNQTHLNAGQCTQAHSNAIYRQNHFFWQ